MMRLVTENGTLIDPATLDQETLTPKDARVDARAEANMTFLSDLGLRLNDRMLSTDVQDIIDRALWADVGKHAA